MRNPNVICYSLLLFICCVGGSLACRDGSSPLSPTQTPSLPNTLPVPLGGPANTTPGVPGGGVDGSVAGCTTLDVQARRVLSTTPTSATILVTVDYKGEGTPYVKFIDKATGQEIHRTEDFGAITIEGLNPETSYSWFVFVEVDEGGHIRQCDGGLSFMTPRLPPPPPQKKV